MKSTFVMMVRGEEDILFSCLKHHVGFKFDNICVISHVEHTNTRLVVNYFRRCSDASFTLIEIDDPDKFTERKGRYINRAIDMVTDPGTLNFIYCSDADEFLDIGRFGSISELLTSLLDSSDIARPLYMTLPWIDLLISRKVRSIPSAPSSDEFLNLDYLALEDSGWNGTKTLFEASDTRSVHMGFHWLHDNMTGDRIYADEASDRFVQQENLCVYHLPMRTFSQFSKRLRHYRRSADPTSKYNVLQDFAEEGRVDPKTVFDLCTSETRAFLDLDELEDYLAKSHMPVLSGHRLETIAKFLTAERRPVGRVLNRKWLSPS